MGIPTRSEGGKQCQFRAIKGRSKSKPTLGGERVHLGLDVGIPGSMDSCHPKMLHFDTDANARSNEHGEQQTDTSWQNGFGQSLHFHIRYDSAAESSYIIPT